LLFERKVRTRSVVVAKVGRQSLLRKHRLDPGSGTLVSPGQRTPRQSVGQPIPMWGDRSH
jgi:hypothetical protein